MDWTRGCTIGRGSTATVSIATAHKSGQVFAVKSAEISQSECLKRGQRILSRIRCLQVITYKGCNITAENGKHWYNLFMEYASGGTLTDAIHKQGGHLDEATIRSYTSTILHGLVYLHSNGVVHCDIKGRNVLIANDGVKIGDLGCARLVAEVSGSNSASTMPIAGTPVFMAPEVARGEQQGVPADVWALGCTVIEMATGRAPWPDVSDPISALYRIGYSGDLPEIPSFLSEQAKDFLDKCLKRDPGERWSASELLRHAFLEEPGSVFKEVHGSYSDSPTGVLDQGFWDSMEEFEITQNPTHTCSSNSPVARIRRLSGGNSASFSRIPNWEWDENWVTVRSSSIKDREIVSCSQDHTMPCANNEPTMTSGSTDTAWVSQDYNLLYPNEPTWTSVTHTYNTSSCSCSSNSCRCNKRGLSMARKCIMETLILEINKEKFIMFSSISNSL